MGEPLPTPVVRTGWLRRALLASAVAMAAIPRCAEAAPEAVLDAIVAVRTIALPDARTTATLGPERRGSGIVLDGSGLVLTIGYIVLEAAELTLTTRAGRSVPAEVIAVDQESGLALARALLPLSTEPAELAPAADLPIGAALFAVSLVDGLGGLPVELADRRTFAGSWGYVLDDALFTVPTFPTFAGAALIDGEGRVRGVGSLLVGDAPGLGVPAPGNMFVPVEALLPVMGELLAHGRRNGPTRPWLGADMAEIPGHVVVLRVAEDTPAARGGLQPGDIVEMVGGHPVAALEGFWRTLWSLGVAGVKVPLTIVREGDRLPLDIVSADRSTWLRRAGSL